MQYPEFGKALVELLQERSPGENNQKQQKTQTGRRGTFPQPEVCLPQLKRPHSQTQERGRAQHQTTKTTRRRPVTSHDLQFQSATAACAIVKQCNSTRAACYLSVTQNFSSDIYDSWLTTYGKFVRDWHLKQFGDASGGEPTLLRRSRLVAREYAFLERRQDVYSPASSTHVLNLLPLLWLQRCGDWNDVLGGVSCSDQVMAAFDIKDAFLEVPQHTPLSIKLAGQTWVVLKNLPGQRLGACVHFWMSLCNLKSAVCSHVWHVPKNVPFSSMWTTSCK